MFRLSRAAALLALALSTAACVTTDKSAQTAVSATPLAFNEVSKSNIAPNEITDAAFTATGAAYDITSVAVVVPPYLVVSEADTFKPIADIVWHGDPVGDRRAQVQQILSDALTSGTTGMRGAQKAILAVQVTRFHAQTPKVRATFGGAHEIEFDYVLLDAETRRPLTEAKHVDATFKALGGRKAYAAERAGQTQKVRISDQVARVIRAELTKG